MLPTHVHTQGLSYSSDRIYNGLPSRSAFQRSQHLKRLCPDSLVRLLAFSPESLAGPSLSG